jgi:Zn-finger nucleic acid-binding protein
MKCPTCTDTALVMSDRQGVDIDYCPQCRGVWLDRGELDKLRGHDQSATKHFVRSCARALRLPHLAAYAPPDVTRLEPASMGCFVPSLPLNHQRAF